MLPCVRRFDETAPGRTRVRRRPLNEDGHRYSDVINWRDEEVRAISLAPDGRTRVSALHDGVIVWDLQSARVRKVLDAPFDYRADIKRFVD